MEHRGRKSIAELSVISGDGIVTVRRPDPPAELTEDQAIEWQAVVNRLPADWFPPETHGMLKQYCRHVIEARRVAAMLDKIVASEDMDVRLYSMLLKEQRSESREISSLSTRMRMSQQSTMSEQRKKPKTLTLPKPWEDK